MAAFFSKLSFFRVLVVDGEPGGLVDGGAVLVDGDRVGGLRETSHLTAHLIELINVSISSIVIVFAV